MERRLRGSKKPRIYTRPLRKLTPETTLGFAVIEFAELVLEITLHPWQKWLLKHALELRPDGSFRFRTLVVSVARQNGKTTVMTVLALYFMYVRGCKMVIGTAQSLDVSEKAWAEAVDWAESIDELNDEILHVDKTNGKKALRLMQGETYKVAAASRRGARGFSGDLILLDELREHLTWDSWGAVTKTTMARADAQVWGFSNAGDVASVVLRHLRLIAHSVLGNPDGLDVEELALVVDEEFDDDDSLGWFEWSAPPGCSTTDREAWAAANPSLGYTITERAIRDAIRTDPEWVFRTEILCQWPDGAIEGPWPEGVWAGCVDAASTIDQDSRIMFCADVAADRSMASIGAAGWRADGRLHGEVAASRAGMSWIVDWFAERANPVDPLNVVVQSRGAPSAWLVEELAAIEGVNVIEWCGPDLAIGTGRFFDLVAEGKMRHLSQPVLDVAASCAATKALGDAAWVWDRRKSPLDISPLVAVTGAAWALMTAPVVTVSSYEERGMVVG